MKRFDRQISPDRGKICYLLILIIKIKYSAAETTTPAITEMDEEHIRLMAVDCTTNDERIRPSKCTMANLMTYEKTMMVHLLQKVSVLAIPGVRCVVKKSSHTWYCGKYAHVHLVRPAEIDQPLLITTDECEKMYSTRSFTYEGINIPVYLHQPHSHQMLVNGSIEFYNDLIYGLDPGCVGEGVWVGNQLVPNSLTEIQITTQARPVTLLQYPEGCYLNDEYIGNRCTASKLRIEADRVIALTDTEVNKKYHFNYRTIENNVMVSLFSNKGNNGQGQQRQILMNPHLSLAVELREKKHFEGVLEELFHYETNIPNFLIWFNNAKSNFFHRVQKDERDPELSANMVASFWKFKHQLIQHADCFVDRSEVSDSIQVHRRGMVRVFGELEAVNTCREIEVTVALGENNGCYYNHLMVFYNASLMGVSPHARVIKNITSLIQVKCEEHPVFLQVKDGKFVGNRGRGMELIKVDDTEVDDDEVQHHWYEDFGANEENEDEDTIEEVHLKNLGLNGHEFKIKIRNNWFSMIYDRTITFIKNSWNNVVVMAGSITLGIVVICCLVCICYIRSFVRCKKVERFDSMEMH